MKDKFSIYVETQLVEDGLKAVQNKVSLSWLISELLDQLRKGHIQIVLTEEVEELPNATQN